MTYSHISYEVLGPVVRVCHNRPDAANAESEALLDELDHALERAKNDPEIRVLILGGKGKHFSSGHDLVDGIATRAHFTPEQIYMWEQEHYLGNAMRIRDFPKPTIAQVQGACIAGGLMVANMCDLMVASEDAFFSDPVVHSLGAAAVEVLIHPWVLGMRKAKEFLFTGERIGAAEAKEWGMVNHVVPRDSLEEFTLRLANKIAEAPPVAMHVLKRSLNRTADIQGFRNSVMAHFDSHVFTHATVEHKEMVARGMKASMAAVKNSSQ